MFKNGGEGRSFDMLALPVEMIFFCGLIVGHVALIFIWC